MTTHEKTLPPALFALPNLAYTRLPRWSGEPWTAPPWLRRTFFPFLQIYMTTVVIAGFAPSFYLRPDHVATMRPIIDVHAGVMTLWILYIAVQGVLPVSGRRRLHRTLGWLGAGLAVLVVASGAAITWQGVQDGWDPFGLGSPEAFAAIPFRDLSTFVLFLVAGLWMRRCALEGHKRMMTLATLSVIPAGLARLGAFVPDTVITALNYGPIVAMIAYDLATQRRPLASTLVGGSILVMATPAALALAHQPAWLATVRALT